MTTDNYLIEFDNIKNMSIKDFLEMLASVGGVSITEGGLKSTDGKLKNIYGKNLNELKLMDLAYHNSQPILPGHGIYIFREGIKVVYVGKATAKSFIERIPAHIDPRIACWFNRLLELVCIKTLNLDWSEENSLQASQHAFSKLNLVLINFKNPNKVEIERFERLLRASAQPLNKFKNIEVNPIQIIANY